MQKFLIVHTALMVLFFPGRDLRPVHGSELVSEEVAVRHNLTRPWFTQASSAPVSGCLEHVVLSDRAVLASSRNGMLDLIDPETGAKQWSVRVGSMDQHTLPPSANDQFVAAINGSKLYMFNRTDGQLAWKQKLDSIPASGPAITDKHVYIPMLNGVMDCYAIEPAKNTPRRVFSVHTSGTSLVTPIITPKHVCWATEKGFVYFASRGQLRAEMRLQTTGPVEGGLGYWTPYTYICSLDQFLYAIDDRTGRMAWHFSAGSPLSARPVAIEGRVYLTPDSGGMFCLDGKTGDELWFAKSARRFVAKSPTRIYAIGTTGNLLVLSAENGRRIDEVPLPEGVSAYLNSQNDRILLTSTSGLIQCLHEPELKDPIAYIPPAEVTAEPSGKDKAKPAAPANESETPPATEGEDDSMQDIGA